MSVDVVELRSIRDDLAAVLGRVDALIADLEPAVSERDGQHVVALPRTRAIEWVLTRRGEGMRPVEIWAELRALGRDDPKMEVQVTTYDLWQRGRIEKVDRGVYRLVAKGSARGT